MNENNVVCSNCHNPNKPIRNKSKQLCNSCVSRLRYKKMTDTPEKLKLFHLILSFQNFVRS